MEVEVTKLRKLLNEMTIEEKVGQLVQLTPDFFSEGGEITGPMQEWHMTPEKLFQIGSVLGTHTAKQVYEIQKQYLEKSRLKIPLVFMADVIHGYETIFPIPLALAATFDEKTVEKVAELSAIEATEAGVHVTFSPMADYVSDARWGRVLESNGEDAILSAKLTSAYVKGYQGSDLTKEKNRLAACVKHFVGYGAAQGGRDYNTADFSDLEMHQNYLPAFQGAIDAGAELVMTSFNTVRGIPATANEALIQGTLREKLGFEGVVISDWAAVAELMAHRVATNKKEAAELAFTAGIDMDMMSDCYQLHLEEIIQPDQQEKLDEAVFRILTLKNKLGLFEDPYRGLTEQSGEPTKTKALREAVRQAAEKSVVLLKNEDILPLKKGKKVALIGPKAESKDILGAWSWIGKTDEAVSLAEGLAKKDIQLTTFGMPDGEEISDEWLNCAKEIAKDQDVVVVAVGETSEESGEAASLANINLSRRQDTLIHALHQVNENIVVVVFSGRPLALTNIEKAAKGILAAWFPGTEGGHALGNVLMGEVNPQGKLPMSFPRSVGQLPLTYGQMSTGRPMNEHNQDQKYISRYMDEKNTPLYAFGHGLSYSEFILENAALSANSMGEDDTLQVTATLKNNTAITGTTVVQLYLQDVITKVARPVRELKKWELITLAGDTSKAVRFAIHKEDLQYIHSDLSNCADKGEFHVYVGFSSESAEYIGTFAYQGS